jgi:hypothetical protein
MARVNNKKRMLWWVRPHGYHTFLLGPSAKNRESGIWLKICKIIAIPEIEILHSRSLPIFPDWELSGKIRRNRVPIIPDNSRLPTHLPDYSQFFPMHQDWSRITARCVWHVRLFRLALSCRWFWVVLPPCIATDNSKGEHCYYISKSYSEEASDDTSVLWNSPHCNRWLVMAAWQNSNVLQVHKHMVAYRQNRSPKLTPNNSRVGNYQELSGKIGIPIIPNFSWLANHSR